MWLGHFGLSEDGRMGGSIISFSDFDFPKEKNPFVAFWLRRWAESPRSILVVVLGRILRARRFEIQSCMNWGTDRDSRIRGAVDCRGAKGWRSDWRGATRRWAFSGRREA